MKTDKVRDKRQETGGKREEARKRRQERGGKRQEGTHSAFAYQFHVLGGGRRSVVEEGKGCTSSSTL
jgi:ribosomal protein S8E